MFKDDKFAYKSDKQSGFSARCLNCGNNNVKIEFVESYFDVNDYNRDLAVACSNCGSKQTMD